MLKKPSRNCEKIIQIDDELKKIILHAHNKRRNIIAGGNQKGYASAIRMPTLVKTQLYLK